MRCVTATGNCGDINPAAERRAVRRKRVQSGGIALTNAGGQTTTTAGQYVFISGSGNAGVPLGQRPGALGKNPLPDPKTCN